MTQRSLAELGELAILGGPKAVGQGADEAARWPLITERHIERVVSLLRSGRISIPYGGVIEEFERRWASYVGTKYALAQNNGTSTLHAAYFAVGVGPGDEVIAPSYTWSASVTPAYALGANVVFAEIDPCTLTLDPQDLEARITSRTKAICVVHLWGNVADMDTITAIARRHGIRVIEDCSHAHGATYKGRRVGSIGDVGCFSMQGSKPLFGGEAGVITTSDDELFDRIVVLGHQGRVAKTARAPEMQVFETGLGFKYRPHPLAIALALEQLDHLDELNAIRGRHVALLDSYLAGLPGVETVQTVPGAQRGGYYEYRFMYRHDELGVDRQLVEAALRAEGVDIGPCRYPLLHQAPLFTQPNPIWSFGRGGSAPNRAVRLPVTERVWPRIFRLPSFSRPAEDVVAAYGRALAKVFLQVDRLKAALPASPRARGGVGSTPV